MTHKDLIENARQYILTHQDEYKDETYCTDRAMAKSEIMGFFAFMGISTDALVGIQTQQ
jgi:hypothetical protein